MSQKFSKRHKINKASDYASRENKHVHRKGRGPKRYNSHRGGRNSNFRRRPKSSTHNQPPAPRRAKSHVNIEAVRDFCVDYLENHSSEYVDVEALRDSVKKSLKLEKLSLIKTGLTMETFLTKYYPRLFDFDQEKHGVRLRVTRKRALEDGEEKKQRKRQKQNSEEDNSYEDVFASYLDAENVGSDEEEVIVARTYCLKAPCEVFPTKECDGKPLYVLSIGDDVEAVIGSGRSDYVEIIEPQRGYCKQFEAIPLLAKSYKMTDLTGAQKMRERQLRQLILEGKGVDIKRTKILMTGSWAQDLSSRIGVFFLTQDEEGALTGYLDDAETCTIEGSVDGNDFQLTQHFTERSAHGAGTLAHVHGTLSSDGLELKMDFECIKENEEETIKGSTHVKKRADGLMTGRWSALGRSGGNFEFQHFSCGRLTGRVVGKDCRILGWVDGDEFRLQQIWGKKSSHSGEVANVWGVIVGEDCVELSYACRYLWIIID